jgi:dGTP triphosphohydrolase
MLDKERWRSKSASQLSRKLSAFSDYLSGMTDRYTILEHQRLFGLKQWSGGVLG